MLAFRPIYRRRPYKKPFDRDKCLESHKTGLISVKTLQVGRKYPRTATQLTYLCTYCMWECNVFLGGLAKAEAKAPRLMNRAV